MVDLSEVTVETSRLRLRPLVAADAEALFGIYSDEQAMRYWSSGPQQSEAEALEMIEFIADGNKAGTMLELGVERLDTGALIGTVTLWQMDAQNRRAELGYMVSRDHWGQGFATELCSAIVAYAFGPLDLIRLEADTDPRNTASIRVLEKLGFQREGYLRDRWIVQGEVSDTAFYGLLRREWHDPAKDLADTAG